MSSKHDSEAKKVFEMVQNLKSRYGMSTDAPANEEEQKDLDLPEAEPPVGNRFGKVEGRPVARFVVRRQGSPAGERRERARGSADGSGLSSGHGLPAFWQ